MQKFDKKVKPLTFSFIKTIGTSCDQNQTLEGKNKVLKPYGGFRYLTLFFISNIF
jgi:hypothetical protein